MKRYGDDAWRSASSYGAADGRRVLETENQIKPRYQKLFRRNVVLQAHAKDAEGEFAALGLYSRWLLYQRVNEESPRKEFYEELYKETRYDYKLLCDERDSFLALATDTFAKV